MRVNIAVSPFTAGTPVSFDGGCVVVFCRLGRRGGGGGIRIESSRIWSIVSFMVGQLLINNLLTTLLRCGGSGSGGSGGGG